MAYFLNKKSAVSGFIVWVLLITAGFVIIFMIVPTVLFGANTAVADTICKGSIALSDKTHTEIRPNFKGVGVTLAEFATPRFCKTSTFDIPEDRNADGDQIKKEIADLMTFCWNRYGEGLIEDVFKEGKKGQKCEVCYIVNLRESSEFPSTQVPSPISQIFGQPDGDGIYEFDAPSATPIWYRHVGNGNWEWTPYDPSDSSERIYWMPVTTTTVSDRSYESEDPVKANKAIIDYLNINKLDPAVSEITVEGIIPAIEFRQYLFTTPYEVTSEDDGCKIDGGFCIGSNEKSDCADKLGEVSGDDDVGLSYIEDPENKGSLCRSKGLTACCYTDYECLNRGGRCESGVSSIRGYAQYDEWECPEGQVCFVKEENYYSYGDYIQRFGGEGNIIITADIVPGETYAISFGSPTDRCGWCGWARTLGMAAGVAASVVLVPVSGGSSLAIAFSVTTIATGATVGAIGGNLAGGVIAESANAVFDSLDDIFEREANTVYLSTLNQIIAGRTEDAQLCTLVG